MSPPKLLRCAVYTRKSTEEGLEQAFNSLDAQREACEAYVMSQTHEGWVVLASRYDDGGFSGGNMDRPGLQALMRDIDRGLVDIVVVYKVDRLTRALADFAKIVERFDKRGVSFVSVTQAFNTTSSMGRLTLNVLLSFAQFEREVTSERIRDKLAASRRKGMWMGGRAPFGYGFHDRKLQPDPQDAAIVQRMFTRYLELGSVRALKEELKAEGIVSKAWVSRHGNPRGGTTFDRGALYHLLQNRIYVGEIRHKTERHKGLHDAIVPRGLFDQVQARLADGRGRQPGAARSSVKHPLAGLLWDDQGHRMSPTHGQKAGQRYRYYVSRGLLNGKAASAIARIPAEPIEALILDRLHRLIGSAQVESSASYAAPNQPSLVRRLVDRIVLGRDTITIRLYREQLEIRLADHAAEQHPHRKIPTPDALRRRIDAADQLLEEGDHLDLIIAARPVKRGVAPTIERPDGEAANSKPRHDPILLKAIARAHGWLDMLLKGEAKNVRAVAARAGVSDGYVSRTIALAFLSPADLALALAGRQPAAFTVDRLTRDDLPIAWKGTPTG
jgi:DNA invertase Pin-like site-specific DNA recombinase